MHIDVWEPFLVSSCGLSNYYMTCINDVTRNVCVYFLKNKFDVLETFKKKRVMVENETNLKVKFLGQIK